MKKYTIIIFNIVNFSILIEKVKNSFVNYIH